MKRPTWETQGSAPSWPTETYKIFWVSAPEAAGDAEGTASLIPPSDQLSGLIKWTPLNEREKQIIQEFLNISNKTSQSHDYWAGVINSLPPPAARFHVPFEWKSFESSDNDNIVAKHISACVAEALQSIRTTLDRLTMEVEQLSPPAERRGTDQVPPSTDAAAAKSLVAAQHMLDHLRASLAACGEDPARLADRIEPPSPRKPAAPAGDDPPDAAGAAVRQAAFLELIESAAGVGTGEDVLAETAILGGPAAVGRAISVPDDLLRAVEAGFRPAVIDALLASGFERMELENLLIPLRTLQRRRQEGRLSPAESDTALRLARILAQATATFGTRDRTFAWLRGHKEAFGGARPIDLLATEAGGRRVEEALLRADLGMTA